MTGGGAYKFADLISEKLGLKVIKVDEMSCICEGANFLLKNIADESFMYERQQQPHYVFQSSNPTDLYPYLLVTIGSGVSVIKVTSETTYERIGGTATGGGTFWGLGRLLTGMYFLLVQLFIECILGQSKVFFSGAHCNLS